MRTNMKIGRHTNEDVSPDKRINDLKSRRRKLQHKKHSILSKLAHINPVVSTESRYSHPHITPSTSIDTSGEVSLPVASNGLENQRFTFRKRVTGGDTSPNTPDLVTIAGKNVLKSRYGGKEESSLKQSIVVEGVDMSALYTPNTPNRIVASEDVFMKQYRPQRQTKESDKTITCSRLTLDTDMSPCNRPQSQNMQTIDTDKPNKKEKKTNIFEANRYLDDGSDDDPTRSTASSRLPSSKSREYRSTRMNDEKLQIPVTRLKSVAYAHGGYASAAPLMLQNSRWMLILQHLMPDAHEDLTSLLNNADQSISDGNFSSHSKKKQHSRKTVKTTDDPLRVMKWAENNPIVTAFGVANCKHAVRSRVKRKKQEGSNGSADFSNVDNVANFMSKRALGQKFGRANISHDNSVDGNATSVQHQRVPPIEWDVFLDPLLVKYVEQAMQRADNLSKSEHETSIAAEIEVDRQVSRLITRMLLAHGSTANLLAEALGMARGYNFSRVVKASEAVRRDLGKKDWSSFTFSCGHNEDSTMDETYTIPSRSMSFNGEHLRMPPPRRSSSGRSRTSNTDGRTGGVFVERWLVLFASALRLGRLDEKSLRDVIYGRNPKRRSEKSESERLHSLSARYLRGSEQGRDCIEVYGREDEGESGNFSEIDMLLRSSISTEEEMFVPTPSCGFFLCLGMDDPGATSADHGKSVMAECVKMISQILGEKLRLVLDLKSRNVPPRVWARLIDNLMAKGLLIDAIGSFDSDELRMIGKHTSSPITLAIFFHSAGDLQRACHANEIRKGDTVYFNAGSLLWKKPTVCEATGMNCCQEADLTMALSQSFSSDLQDYKRGRVKFEPYAFLKHEIQRTGFTECKATLADYQKRFDLNIGLYVQEFAIGSEELNSLVKLVNDRPSIYNLGLAWGGLNGYATKLVQGDGFWKQRYVGRNWDTTAGPSKDMKLLAPEDHRFVQKVILAGQCGQVTTAHRLLDGIFDDDLAQNSICESPALKPLKRFEAN